MYCLHSTDNDGVCIIYTYTHILHTGEPFEMPSEVLAAESGGTEVVVHDSYIFEENKYCCCVYVCEK